MTYPYFIVAVIIVGYLLLILGRSRDKAKADMRVSERHYAYAVSLVQQGDFEEAIMYLGLSIGTRPSHEAYNTLGHVWGSLDRWDLAADAFSHARGFAGYGPDNPNISRDSIDHPEEVCRYFLEEASAYARDSNWEFAYMRSQTVLDLIQAGQLPRYIDEGDCESWIRVVHMLAAVQFLKGREAISAAKKDANWLLENSKVTRCERLANVLINGPQKLSELRPRILEAWREYDKDNRRRGMIVVQ